MTAPLLASPLQPAAFAGLAVRYFLGYLSPAGEDVRLAARLSAG